MKKRNSKTCKKSMSKTTITNKKLTKKDIKGLEVANPHAAGVDIGSEEHWVCVPEETCSTEANARPFGCYTPDLHEICRWLKECNVTTVALESTGVYWIPLYQLLEKQGFEVCLVNTKHMKNVQGRPKTDRLDCKWLMRLHSYGLLAPSFRPSGDICELRTFMRWNETLINDCADYIRRMAKALQQMNVRLDKAVTDITGTTGIRIIEGIISGCYDPSVLAEMRDCRCKKSVEEIAKALSGDYREEHIYVLKEAYEIYKFYQQKLTDNEAEIEKWLKKLTPSKAAMKAAYKKLHEMTNGEIDLSNKGREEVLDTIFPERSNNKKEYLISLLGVDVTAIPGIDIKSTQLLISEIGLDFSAWQTAQHFTAWLGLAPLAKQSGKSYKKQHTAKVQSRAAEAFRMAAESAARSKTSYLGTFYWRIKARAGGSVAITATARKIAVIFYSMITKGTEYQDLGRDYQHKYCSKKYLKKTDRNLREYGYKIVPLDADEKEQKKGA